MSIIEKASERIKKLPIAIPPASAASQQAVQVASEDRGVVAQEAERLGRSDLAPSNAPPRIRNTVVQFDFERLARDGYLTPATAVGQIVEQYRALKRPLLRKLIGDGTAQDDPVNPVVITSALPREGKTFTAFNLAMSIAMERDLSVLLVDADLSRRSLSVLVGLAAEPGLSDLLADPRMDLADVILKTNMPKLRLIPAGRVHEHTTELLSSGQMRRVVRELVDRYPDRLVLVDAAPVLSTSEATALCDLAAQVLFVVEEGKTSQQSVKDALALLDGDKSVGLVLNKSLRFWNGGYSPYYGGY